MKMIQRRTSFLPNLRASILLSTIFLVGSSQAQSSDLTCALQLNTHNCPTLVQSQTPIASCGENACYNYCNDVFSGCCPPGQACAVDCVPQPKAITISAGCRLSDAPQGGGLPVPPPPPSSPPVIVASGTVAPPPTPPPPPRARQCVMRQNPENCPKLVQNQPVVAGCGANGCYNYCNDEFAGCCGIDDMECSMKCSGIVGDLVMTSGCRLWEGDDLPPTPPAPRPTPPPKQCVLRRNTSNCPTFTATQKVVSSCGADGCYNYCNGKFAGCCDIDDMECKVKCTETGPGPTPPEIVITAGCRLNQTKSPTRRPTPSPSTSTSSSTCRVAGKSCVRGDQCCSQRCVSFKCLKKQ